jgi:hypothetical protein
MVVGHVFGVENVLELVRAGGGVVGRWRKHVVGAQVGVYVVGEEERLVEVTHRYAQLLNDEHGVEMLPQLNLLEVQIAVALVQLPPLYVTDGSGYAPVRPPRRQRRKKDRVLPKLQRRRRRRRSRRRSKRRRNRKKRL